MQCGKNVCVLFSLLTVLEMPFFFSDSTILFSFVLPIHSYPPLHVQELRYFYSALASLTYIACKIIQSITECAVSLNFLALRNDINVMVNFKPGGYMRKMFYSVNGDSTFSLYFWPIPCISGPITVTHCM